MQDTTGYIFPVYGRSNDANVTDLHFQSLIQLIICIRKDIVSHNVVERGINIPTWQCNDLTDGY